MIYFLHKTIVIISTFVTNSNQISDCKAVVFRYSTHHARGLKKKKTKIICWVSCTSDNVFLLVSSNKRNICNPSYVANCIEPLWKLLHKWNYHSFGEKVQILKKSMKKRKGYWHKICPVFSISPFSGWKFSAI